MPVDLADRKHGCPNPKPKNQETCSLEDPCEDYDPDQDPRDGTLNVPEIALKCFIDKKKTKASERGSVRQSVLDGEESIRGTELKTFVEDYGHGRFEHQGQMHSAHTLCSSVSVLSPMKQPIAHTQSYAALASL